MELRVLEYFLAVAREESITAAANALHLSQPTLSRQLKDMEDELGKQLFIRGSKKIELTDEGKLNVSIKDNGCEQWGEDDLEYIQDVVFKWDGEKFVKE